MKKYEDAIRKMIEQLDDHIARLEDSDSDISAEKVTALEAFRENIDAAIEELIGDWPQQ